MSTLLLTILAVSLVVTLVGFFLSSKPQGRREQTPYRAVRYDERQMSRRMRVVEPPLRSRRISAYTEQRTGWNWAVAWQPSQIGRVLGKPTSDPTSWIGIILVLVSVFLLGLFMLRTLLPSAGLSAMGWSGNLTEPASISSNNSSTQIQAHYQASQALVRVGQVDPAQYNSTQDFNTWAYSACSTAAMTEVINAYGYHYRIADILKVEAQIGAITPQQGLLDGSGIQQTAAHFGFKTTYMQNETLNDVIKVANAGTPVIVGFPPAKYAGGHLLVVTGGNAAYVYLADSSLYNRHSLTHAQFMNWWAGFAAIVTPE
ncbi:MAG TPA: cysteine peptidase family C39 domain-containing protein [Ktedonobacteraceae bacterium]|nr:cysteine peptidase family C39 domain-containing protein [Ktedonobacteraceae bacterium]